MRQSFFLRRAYILEAGQQWLTTFQQRPKNLPIIHFHNVSKFFGLAVLVDVNFSSANLMAAPQIEIGSGSKPHSLRYHSINSQKFFAAIYNSKEKFISTNYLQVETPLCNNLTLTNLEVTESNGYPSAFNASTTARRMYRLMVRTPITPA